MGRRGGGGRKLLRGATVLARLKLLAGAELGTPPSTEGSPQGFKTVSDGTKLGALCLALIGSGKA